MLYQIDNKAIPIDEMVAAGKLLVGLMQSKVLVSVEPCEHGNYARHIVWMNDNGTNLQCDGAALKGDT